MIEAAKSHPAGHTEFVETAQSVPTNSPGPPPSGRLNASGTTNAGCTPGASVLDRLIAEGRIVPARLDLTELGPPPEQPCEISISEALAAQREER